MTLSRGVPHVLDGPTASPKKIRLPGPGERRRTPPQRLALPPTSNAAPPAGERSPPRPRRSGPHAKMSSDTTMRSRSSPSGPGCRTSSAPRGRRGLSSRNISLAAQLEGIAARGRSLGWIQGRPPAPFDRQKTARPPSQLHAPSHVLSHAPSPGRRAGARAHSLFPLRTPPEIQNIRLAGAFFVKFM